MVIGGQTKTMKAIKYCKTCARLDSFKIHEMNIQADLRRSIENELLDKLHKRQVGFLTQQPQGLTATIKTLWQFNHTLKDLLSL